MQRTTTTIEHDTPEPSRGRACASCRESKIKCIRTRDQSKCKSCQTHGRPCLSPGPPKKRVRTAQKILDLEDKIDQLSKQVKNNHELESRPTWQATQKPTSQGNDSDNLTQLLDELDLDSTTISMLFNHWQMDLRPFMPFIDVSPTESYTSFRARNPSTFLIVLAAASISALPARTPSLMKASTSHLAQSCYVDDHRDADVIQSLLIHSLYHLSPTKDKTFTFSQHIYSASIIAFDLGYDKITLSPSNKDIKNMQLWLAAFYNSTIITVLLNRQRLAFDVSNVQGVVKLLRGRPEGDHSQLRTCTMADVAEIVNTASAKDRSSGFTDKTTQQKITALHRRLDECGTLSPIASELDLHTHLYHSVKLYIYRSAIIDLTRKLSSLDATTYHDSDSFSSLTALHHGGLLNCLESSQEVLRRFISLKLLTIRCLPVTYLLWTLFAGVCLLKIAPFAETVSSTPDIAQSNGNNSNLSTGNPSHILDQVVTKLDHVCQQGYMPQARPFRQCFAKLKHYYLHRKQVCINSRTSASDNHEVLLQPASENENQDATSAVDGTKAQKQKARATDHSTFQSSIGRGADISNEARLENIPVAGRERPEALDFTFEGEGNSELAGEIDMYQFDLLFANQDDQWLNFLM